MFINQSFSNPSFRSTSKQDPLWEGNGHAATLFGMVQTMRQERIFRFSFWRNAIFTKSRVIDIALDTEPKLKQTYETYLALHDA